MQDRAPTAPRLSPAISARRCASPCYAAPALAALLLLAPAADADTGDTGGLDTGRPALPFIDVDGDGWDPHDGDCDDLDPAVNPAADEICNDIDDDCDELVDAFDDDLVDGFTGHADHDGDGFGSEVATTRCHRFPRVFDDTDCDDHDADVNPDAEEVCRDGIDNDCSGEDELCAADTLDADAIWYGVRDGDALGAAVVSADLDGDGTAELIVSAPSARSGGELYAFDAASSGELSAVDALYAWTSDTSPAALNALQAEDIDGDGLEELVVQAASEQVGGATRGGVHLLAGGGAGGVVQDEATASWYGAAGAILNDAAVLVTGLDGGSAANLLLGDDDDLYVVDAEVTGLQLAVDGVRIRSTTTHDWIGDHADGAGDLNGDGYTDLVLGGWGDDVGGAGSGAVYAVHGPVTADLSASDADATIDSSTAAENLGPVRGAGDLDGDGYDDVLIGGPGYSSSTGQAYLFLGPLTDGGPTDATATFQGEAGGDGFGRTLEVVGDIDGDSSSDVAIGAFGADSGRLSDAGRVYLYTGTLTGTVSPTDASTWDGTNNRAYLGRIAGIGDVDADGYGDLLFGASGASLDGDRVGAAYLVHGEAGL